MNLGFISCTKLVEVDVPTNSITGDNVYETDATASSVLTGIYASLSSTSEYNNSGFTTISLFAGLSADEFVLYDGISSISPLNYYYKNQLSENSNGSEYWDRIYPYIFICNDAIAGLSNSTSLTPSVKNQLIGEAKFLRAFFYFYLVNLYGDAPLLLTTDYKKNSSLSRTPVAEIYRQIIEDLKEAQVLLSSNYLKGDLTSTTSERIRPTKWAATALLARVYLYTGDWVNSGNEASSVINNSALYSLNSINDVFLKNNKEAIWQLQPVNSNRNTEDARFFIIPSTGLSDNYPVHLSDFLINRFEVGDQRRENWVGKFRDTLSSQHKDYYYPYKYKVNSEGASLIEYLMILRLGEQYLIRSEARAQMNMIAGSQSDLNAIRFRAGLNDTNASDKNSLLVAIAHERQVELFSEFGHRWFDLKRSNMANATMTVVTPQKGGSWDTFDLLYPIPLTDIQRNKNLIQNPGY